MHTPWRGLFDNDLPLSHDMVAHPVVQDASFSSAVMGNSLRCHRMITIDGVEAATPIVVATDQNVQL
jgi:hypothetical protein